MSQSLPLLMHLLGSDDPAMYMNTHFMEAIRMAACVGEREHNSRINPFLTLMYLNISPSLLCS